MPDEIHRIERISREAAKRFVHRVHQQVDYLNSVGTRPPFQEPITQRGQLMRYRRMQPQDWTMEIAQKGDGEAALHWMKMERLAFQFAKQGKEIFDTEPPEEAVY